VNAGDEALGGESKLKKLTNVCRLYVLALTLTVLALSAQALPRRAHAAEVAVENPNVILILSDDQS
jgi:hypothetical protein